MKRQRTESVKKKLCVVVNNICVNKISNSVCAEKLIIPRPFKGFLALHEESVFAEKLVDWSENLLPCMESGALLLFSQLLKKLVLL